MEYAVHTFHPQDYRGHCPQVTWGMDYFAVTSECVIAWTDKAMRF
jgi:hypothetical protein